MRYGQDWIQSAARDVTIHVSSSLSSSREVVISLYIAYRLIATHSDVTKRHSASLGFTWIMSEMSDDEYTWEDAEEGVTLDMEALLDEIDGEYRPPEEYEDDDDDYVDFDDEDDDYEPGLHIDDGEYEVREMDESEDEDDGGPFAHEHSDVAGAHISLVQLAALMNATTGEGAASLVERLLGPGRGFGVPRQRSLGQQAAQKISERWWKPQVEPHPAGMALLQSGEFGPVGPWSAGTTRRRPSEIYTARRYAAGPYARADGARRYTSTRYFTSAHVREPPIPNTMGTVVAAYPDVPYVGQFCGNDDSMFCKWLSGGANGRLGNSGIHAAFVQHECVHWFKAETATCPAGSTSDTCHTATRRRLPRRSRL